MFRVVKNIRFYPFIAIVMIIINVIGFAPSYFLKPFYTSPDLPIWTHIHGIIFTSWFVLFLLQSILIKNRMIQWHKKMGVIGGFLAFLMIFSALQIIYYRVLEYDGSQHSLENTSLVFAGNMILLVLFTVFVILGFKYRKRGSWHKRFMLLACISMMPQAFGRIGRMPMDSLISNLPNTVLFGLGGMLAFIFILWGHDLLNNRRLHPVSGFGGPFLMVMIILAAVVLPGTEFVQKLIIWLNSTA